MPAVIDSWYVAPMRPRTAGGETSATYMGERMETPPTASPPINLPTRKTAKFGAVPVAMEVTTNKAATHSSIRCRPYKSVSLPAMIEPRAQPNNSELKAQPKDKSLSPNCGTKNGPAPTIMAMSKPKSSPPNAAVAPKNMT